MKNKMLFLFLVLVFCGCLSAQPAAKEPGIALTIYNDNLAVVRDRRNIDFQQGINTIKFTDVASQIDPTSVTFESLSQQPVEILEQNYEYDLVDTASLLKRYIDKPVGVSLKGSGADVGKNLDGTLLSAKDSDLIIISPQGAIKIIDRSSIEEIFLTRKPEDLVTKPTLVWLANSQTAGPQLCKVSYMTGAIGWSADYSAILNEDDTKLDFSGWVTIDNQSGAAYKDADIKLIAGDVRRVQPPAPVYMDKRMSLSSMKMEQPFEEKAFMEYHMYTLGRKSTINNLQTKQIMFIEPVLQIDANKIYIYQRDTQPDKVQIKIEFENKADNKLGIALPKGKVRVFKKDTADGTLEFVGEDAIDHTPKNEKLSLYIGNAFDIVPEYKMLDSSSTRRSRTQTHQVELRNRKDSDVTVFVDEKFSPQINWNIDKSSQEYIKKEASTARFEVKIKADSTAVLEYTATENW